MVNRQHGFTLIEVIVAMAILAFITTMAYGSLNHVARTQDILETQAKRVDRLQRVMTILERDFLQMMPRAVRNTFGGFSPAMTSNGTKVSFTRTGRKFIKGIAQWPHSSMSRVAYFLDGDKLVRETWSVLDLASTTVTRRAILLENVKTFRVQLLNASRNWQSDWPPPREDGTTSLTNISLPRFVRFDLELEGLGTITRILPGVG